MSNAANPEKVFSGSLTHEQYIHEVRKIAIARLNAEYRKRLLEAKLVYGSGGGRVARGQCFFDAWHRNEATALIEVCAFGEESSIQLAGTTIHELGHCLAGSGAGHGKAWKEACRTLGLIRCSAAGQAYGAKDFDSYVWPRLIVLAEPSDWNPVHRRKLRALIAAPAATKSSPCPLGNGARGGTSRGPGSGSRLRLYMCACVDRPFKVRVARDDFAARCLRCGVIFERVMGGRSL